MLPTAPRVRSSSSASRSNNMFALYLRRIWQQMDIQYTFWQMLHLCTSPKFVYQHTKYHKQTKNQWARDDPAFVVISSLLLVVAVSAYCATYIFVIISVFLFHFLVTGAILSTFCWGTTALFGPEFTMEMRSIIRMEVRNYMTELERGAPVSWDNEGSRNDANAMR